MATPATLVLVPVVPTPAMIAAADQASSPAAIWSAMVAAVSPTDSKVVPIRSIRSQLKLRRGDLPSAILTTLPTTGVARRNPKFWTDLEVRRLVMELHRQVTVQEALAEIAAHVGEERTPSKSALARAWKRIDLLNKRNGSR